MPQGISKQTGREVNLGVTFGPKLRRMKKTDVAWLAGLFDGEGTLYVQPTGSKSGVGTGCANLIIVNTNLELLSKVCEITGVGLVSKSGKPQKSNHAQKYHWKCYGMNAVELLCRMLPWLIVKREKAIQVITLYLIDPS